MTTLEIIALVGVIYIALDILLGIIIYAIIRCKGWKKWDIAVNFRNLLRLRNRAFKESIAEQIGYADYDTTYNEGYNDGYDARVAEEEEERTRAEERKYKSYIGGNLLTDILGLFGGLFK